MICFSLITSKTFAYCNFNVEKSVTFLVTVEAENDQTVGQSQVVRANLVV